MKTILKEDVSRKFWPSSPSNGVGVWGNSQDPTRHAHSPNVNVLSYTHTEAIRIIGEFGIPTNPLQNILISNLGFARSLDFSPSLDSMPFEKLFLCLMFLKVVKVMRVVSKYISDLFSLIWILIVM